MLAEGLLAVVVNARQVRDFAKGTGQLAKTDAIDAAILAHFGEVVQTTVRPLESKDILWNSARFTTAASTVRMLAVEKTIAMPLRVAPPRCCATSNATSATSRHGSLSWKTAWMALSKHRLPSVPKTTFW